MQFDSLAAVLAMDGHGAYVWAVVAITAMTVAWLLLAPLLRARRELTAQRDLLQRAQGEARRAPGA